MTNPKAEHYDHELHSALTRGAWADGSPAKAANGTPISWSELFRKFRKHNVRTHSTSQHIFTELAAQNQSLSILLLEPRVDVRNIRHEDLDVDGIPNSDTLELGDECLLTEERIEDGRLGFAALELLNDTPQDRDSIRLTRAYFAYALGQFQDCINLVKQAKCMRVTTETLASGNKEVTSVQRPTTAESTTNTGSVKTIISDLKGRITWPVIEQIRGRCLQGMAYERLERPTEALASYEFALPLLDELSVPPVDSTSSTADPSFTKHRELWRWTERLLWRVSVLASKHSSIHTALAYLRKYNSFTLYYPAFFRTGHRGVATMLHLKALFATICEGKPKLSWVTEARTLVEEYRVVLAVCTNFPKAGERNWKVEEYCDGLMAVWERSGADGMDSRWVIDILWWASRMTFHSHRVFRHLTRVLHAAGENDLALRCFRLYIQLVIKTRQTHLEEIEATVRKRRTLYLEDTDVDGTNFTEETPDPTEDASSQGSDDDRQFVEFLGFGCRMVCRLPGTPEDAKWAVEQLEMAKSITLANSKLSRDKQLRARLACAAGVADAILAHREADPNTRPSRMRSALDHFQSAVQLDTESADIYFHLTIALLRAGPSRDIDGAVRAAKHAVELEPTEVRYWHLLGLALSANGENVQAREVLMIGEGMEQTEDSDTPADATGTETPNANVADVDVPTESPSVVNSLLTVSATRVPIPTTMLLPLPDHPPPSKHERFEHALQLRMTLMALVELMDGRDSAAQKWVDAFAWFAERGGWVVHQDETLRDSFDLPPIDPLPPNLTDESVTDDEQPHRPPQLTLTRSLSNGNGGDGMPITLIPPSPRESGDAESVYTLRNDKEGEPEVSKRKKAQQKAQRIIKEQVEKRQSQIQTISRKLGRSGTMRSNISRVSRHSSTPDFNVLLAESRLYQASSIHSRARVTSPRGSYIGPPAPSSTSTPPPPGPTVTPFVRTPRERRLLSDLWLMSAATFRRMEKYGDSRAAIQDAEKHDEGNEGVWVQLGLYFSGLGDNARAIAAFHKALVISPDYIPAIVHLSEQYLHPSAGQSFSLVKDASEASRGAVDLAAGMLSSFTKGVGWDVPEAWYLLAKAVGMQGRKERQRVCLTYALGLVEGNPIRDLRVALGYAL